MAPIALPAGQPAAPELQIEPVAMRKQSAAADVAERQVDFVARAALDVIERDTERARGVPGLHAERQRHIVRRRRDERRRVGTAERREALRIGRSKRRAGQGTE